VFQHQGNSDHLRAGQYPSKADGPDTDEDRMMEQLLNGFGYAQGCEMR
jgi:hypothetical protein